MHSCFWLAPLALVLLSAPAFAQIGGIEKGKRLPTVSATAASGKWRERAAFDAATYGKVRGVSPATSPEAKVVLYTDDLREDFFKIAQAVDAALDNAPAAQTERDWSFVQVTDAKGAQRGGYTASELTARLAQIQAMAKKHNIKHLSFVIAAPGRPTTTPGKIVTLVHAQAGASRYQSGVVDWVVSMPASELQGETLSKQIIELAALLGKKGTDRP